jgi:hypothetical protein
MSIVDGTHLPEHLRAIKAKYPEERTALETATLDAYLKEYGSDGVDKFIQVVDVEKAAPASGKKSLKSSGWKI